MRPRKYSTEKIIVKLREAEVLISQGMDAYEASSSDLRVTIFCPGLSRNADFDCKFIRRRFSRTPLLLILRHL